LLLWRDSKYFVSAIFKHEQLGILLTHLIKSAKEIPYVPRVLEQFLDPLLSINHVQYVVVLGLTGYDCLCRTAPTKVTGSDAATAIKENYMLKEFR